MGVRYAVLMLMLLTGGRSDRVSIAVVPTVSLVNGTARLTCTVPRNPDNRWLVLGAYYDDGVVYQSSMKQLDGKDAPVTHVLYIQHIPCDLAAMSCLLYDTLGKQYAAVQTFTVSGCNP